MNLSKLKQAEAVFLHRYPGGFENPELKAIRDQKHKPDQMIALAQESFAEGKFKLPELMVKNMEKVISHSSIVSVFEKMRFRDFVGMLSAQERDGLNRGLEELLHGTQETGFEMILDLLKRRRLAKWTLMTVCQTYYYPQRDVFVKPNTVKGVLKYYELEDLHYKPTPSWVFYESYRSAFHEMKAKVDKSLAPTNPAFSGFLLMSIHDRLF
jgi:hypothetical protein